MIINEKSVNTENETEVKNDKIVVCQRDLTKIYEEGSFSRSKISEDFDKILNILKSGEKITFENTNYNPKLKDEKIKDRQNEWIRTFYGHYAYNKETGLFGLVTGIGSKNYNGSKFIHFDILVPGPKYRQIKITKKNKLTNKNETETFYLLQKLNYAVRTSFTIEELDTNGKHVSYHRNIEFIKHNKTKELNKLFIENIENLCYLNDNYVNYIKNCEQIYLPYDIALEIDDFINNKISSEDIIKKEENTVNNPSIDFSEVEEF